MYILGISAFFHDSAACLIKDEEIIAAAQEERFTRKKHDKSFPRNAIAYVLAEAGITLDQVDHVAFFEKPFLKFERLIKIYLAEAPRGFRSFVTSIPIWLKHKLFLKSAIIKELGKSIETKLLFSEQHQSQAASCFYPSPFRDAAILTIDGVGEWATTSIAHGIDNKITFLKEINFPHSLGLFYSAFTYYLGFKVNSGEYKVMGLAPYGEVFGRKARKSESDLTQFEMDVARSLQEVTEEIMIKIARTAQKITGSKNLVMAGGVPLNCVGNGKILQEKIFENIWIQPAAGGAGGAMGAAQAAYYQYFDKPRNCYKTGEDNIKGSYLGKKFSNEEVSEYLDSIDAIYIRAENEDQLLNLVCESLQNEKVIGWHQDRMEFGPRSLGARSILGDARSEKMQSKMNLKIKYRESFRPFATAVLSEKASEYFDINCDSPYMLIVAPIKKDLVKKMDAAQEKLFGIEKLNVSRSTIPAVTHVDYSARVQTVHQKTNPRFHNLLKKFSEKSGSAVVINTSFNVPGEPIVYDPQDSYKCFMRTEMDVLVIEDFILYKEDQPNFADKEDWQQTYELD